MNLLKTIHGSRLYNLHHEDSDYDTFTVIADNPTVKGTYAKQTIKGDADDLVTDLSTFVLYASRGVPQYLEAMWSRKVDEDVDMIRDMRFAFRPDFYKASDTYIRTLVNFWNKTDLKYKRHAYRLVLNLKDMREIGMFDPTLTDSQVEQVTSMLREDADPREYLK